MSIGERKRVGFKTSIGWELWRVCSGCLDESKERWYVCLKGGDRGILCGTKTTPELCKLEQGNQVRGVAISCFNDIICNCDIY